MAMTILYRPPSDWKRPGTPPLHVQVKVLLRQLGLAGKVVHWDHRPTVESRQFDTVTRDTIPPFFDPAHLEAITDEEHDKRTHGPGGEKRITTAGSDAGNRRKVRHLIADQEEFVRKLLAKRPGRRRSRRSTIPSRPFAKRPKKNRGR
jgi:hypothetical protein